MTGPGEGGSHPFLVGVEEEGLLEELLLLLLMLLLLSEYRGGCLVRVKVEDSPKSAIFSVLLLDVSLCTRRFSGLRSRCAMLLAWQ